MLISARDLVLRLRAPDEKAIRLGLSGNLCRCTGYVGIVNAVKEVIAARQSDAGAPKRTALGPVGAHVTVAMTMAATSDSEAAEWVAPIASTAFTPTHSFEHSFRLGASPERVFAFFSDVRAVAAAVPGLKLTRADDRSAEGAFSVGLGPVAVEFKGEAQISRDPSTLSGRVVAAGGDRQSASRARGLMEYTVRPADGGALVTLKIGYALTGLLAQLGRPGLIEAVARGLIGKFANQVEQQLGVSPPSRSYGWKALVMGPIERFKKTFR
jgi:carbon-monoxide dehydrogenase small subunit